MVTTSRWTRNFVVTTGIVVGVMPLLLYWVLLGRTPSIGPEQAKELLSRPDASAMLVDVRPAVVYAAGHIEAARNWPLAEINALGSMDRVPADMKGKRLLIICDSGILSGLATRKLRELGVTNLLNVEGGMQAWVATAEKPCSLTLCKLKVADSASQGLPFRESPAYEQWAAVLTGFGVKPTYMTMAAILALVLWRQRSPDLVALRWAMITFFIGEAFCAANYFAYGEQSRLFEYLHSFGMLLSFGFTTYAVFEALDLRLIKYSDPEQRCAALGLCHRCIKHADVPCGLKRLFLLFIPATIVLAFMPLCAVPHAVSYNTRIWDTFYNYSHPVIHQVYEIRFCPVVAIMLLAISLLTLWFRKQDAVATSKIFFAAAMAPLGFSFLRLVLFASYRENLVWFAFWEEMTELLFVVTAVVVLIVFRSSRRGLAGCDSTRSIE